MAASLEDGSAGAQEHPALEGVTQQYCEECDWEHYSVCDGNL
jgi:hypothetical protein